MMRTIFYGAVGLLLLFTACEADEPCDEGEREEQGGCVPDDDESSGGSSSSAGKDAGSGPRGGSSSAGKGGAGAGDKDAGSAAKDAGAMSECSEQLEDILDAPCTTDDDCNCAAPYCAKMPGAAMGTCTVFCTTEPDDCPDGHRCFDLSMLGVEGYEPFCIKM
jgi:hypothetical protein